MKIPLGTYGTDIKYNGEDIYPSLEIQNTEIIVLESIVRRLKSDLGSLFYDPEYGYNLNNLIKSPEKISEMQIQNECLKDERVSKAIAKFAWLDNETLQITLNISLIFGGTFRLIFDIRTTEIEVAYEALS